MKKDDTYYDGPWSNCSKDWLTKDETLQYEYYDQDDHMVIAAKKLAMRNKVRIIIS